MTPEQEQQWKDYPVKVMIGDYSTGNFNGFDLCLLQNDKYVYIPIYNLLSIIAEMRHKNMIPTDSSTNGIAIIFGNPKHEQGYAMPILTEPYISE